MSHPSDPSAASSGPEELQFDHAEFEAAAPPGLTCTGCQRPIETEYFDVNGSPFCATCRDGVESHLRSGSGTIRIIRALIFGSVAALVCTIGYFAFIHFTHIDAALISILVGVVIGKAVRKGSKDRGGLIYQLLAVVLTYFSIATTYTALAISQMPNVAQQAPADPAVAEVDESPKAEEKAVDAPKVEPAVVDAPVPPVVAAPRPVDPNFDFVMFSRFLIAAVGLLIQIPFLMAQDSPITLLIVAFGLWQAWKSNTRLQLAITGPYRIGGPGGRPVENLAHG